VRIALLTGCNDKHYQLSLLSGLISHGVEVDFIGNDDMIDAAAYEGVSYFNLRGEQDPQAPLWRKALRIMRYYMGLIGYAASCDTKVFHIQWLNRFEYFDRTLLNVYYKALGKKIVFTAHNVNARKRDGNDSLLNRMTLRFMYKIVDHIIVHTEKMSEELVKEFGVGRGKITVIPHGIHDSVPCTSLTPLEARERLGLGRKERVILFFGNIRRYKGLEYVVRALPRLKRVGCTVRLLIAGRISDPDCWERIESIVDREHLEDSIMRATGYVPDEDVEVYLKASDLMVLPYTHVFQSGVLFLAYNFGLPVVVADVGSLREEVVVGETGYVCKPADPEDLAEKIALYFNSELYRNLEKVRPRIIQYAREKYSWRKIGKMTLGVYQRMMGD